MKVISPACVQDLIMTVAMITRRGVVACLIVPPGKDFFSPDKVLGIEIVFQKKTRVVRKNTENMIIRGRKENPKCVITKRAIIGPRAKPRFPPTEKTDIPVAAL